MFLLLKNLPNLQLFYEQTKIKHLINVLNLPVRNNWPKWEKKSWQLTNCEQFSYKKTEEDSEKLKTFTASHGKHVKANKSRRHFVPAINVTQSETFSPTGYLQKCPLRNKYTQHVQFSIKRNKPWKSPLDIG